MPTVSTAPHFVFLLLFPYIRPLINIPTKGQTVPSPQPAGRLEAYQKEAGRNYLESIATREGVYNLKSGMLVEIIEESRHPNPKSPNKGDNCRVSYCGTFINGTTFDENTTSFTPSQVIDGWTEAMQYMVEGDKWRLHVPYSLAYGEEGNMPRIPPFATLVFRLEILQVNSSHFFFLLHFILCKHCVFLYLMLMIFVRVFRC